MIVLRAFEEQREGTHTGASIQVLNWVSKAWHPATLYPEDAQHATNRMSASANQ